LNFHAPSPTMSADMDEFTLIAAIRRLIGKPAPPVRVGPGDDAAVLAPARGAAVVTTDTQIDGVHFRLGWQKPREAGEKAVEITLSDLAAMGARARVLFVSLQLPKGFPDREALEFVRGICGRAKRRASPVAGGNVTAYEGPLSVTLTALGEMPRGRKPLLRSGARTGDIIAATGIPGSSRIGFEALYLNLAAEKELKSFVRKHLRPRARLEEVDFIASRISPGAVIDLSDGLGGDLGHVLRKSGVGAVLEPILPRSYLKACRLIDLDPVECFLGPSDDYEILFTARPAAWRKIEKEFKKRFRRALFPIGRIVSRKGFFIPGVNRRPGEIEPRSFRHFF